MLTILKKKIDNLFILYKKHFAVVILTVFIPFIIILGTHYLYYKVLPREYFFEYDRVVPADNLYNLEEKPIFISYSNIKKNLDLKWNDILYCDVDFDGHGYLYFTNYQSSRENVKPSNQKSKPWVYNIEGPNIPATCYLSSSITAVFPYGIEKRQHIESEKFRFEPLDNLGKVLSFTNNNDNIYKLVSEKLTNNSQVKNLLLQSPEVDEDTAQKYDTTWDDIKDSYTQNILAEYLRSIINEYPQIGEILLTDSQGNLVASTVASSDFIQSDEKWWQEAQLGKTENINHIYDSSIEKLGYEYYLLINNEESNEILGTIKIFISGEREAESEVLKAF